MTSKKEQIMTTGSVAIYDKPLGCPKRKYRDFDVPSDVFRRFSTGRKKFERWSKYLNLQDENQKAIYDYARKNRDSVIVLRNSDTGALRAIRPKASNE
jgi:hypothetical protein